MNSPSLSPPPVIVFAGFDGSGGAGVLADCRALTAEGCLPLAVMTSVTAQNLDTVQAFWSLSAVQVRAQYSAIAAAAAAAAAVKIGVTGKNAATIAACLRKVTAPVVWDPVIAPTRGAAFSSPAAVTALKRQLLARADIITPNRRELLQLGEAKRPATAIKNLFAASCRQLLVTDINGSGKTVQHILLSAAAPHTPLWETTSPRLRGTFHGSGCLFSSLLAARLAHGNTPARAAAAAHRRTLTILKKALHLPALGKQKLPL